MALRKFSTWVRHTHPVRPPSAKNIIVWFLSDPITRSENSEVCAPVDGLPYSVLVHFVRSRSNCGPTTCYKLRLRGLRFIHLLGPRTNDFRHRDHQRATYLHKQVPHGLSPCQTPQAVQQTLGFLSPLFDSNRPHALSLSFLFVVLNLSCFTPTPVLPRQTPSIQSQVSWPTGQLLHIHRVVVDARSVRILKSTTYLTADSTSHRRQPATTPECHSATTYHHRRSST